MLPNLKEDWRFRNSPHVAQSGLRSYAGAQLRCRVQNGRDVALGSLCVASLEDRQPLSSSQQAVLVKFADMLSQEIITRSRAKRKAMRAHMSELIAASYALPALQVQQYLVGIVRQVYPDAEVSMQTASQHRLPLPNRKSYVSLDQFRDGLWEDSAHIDHLIETQNHKKLESLHVLRAVAHAYHSVPDAQYLVVSSNQVQLVFDNVDSWFVERCAQRLRESIQEAQLTEALLAKDIFLRGITHQLRTPIHGVLGACELLVDELSTEHHSKDNTGQLYTPRRSADDAAPRQSAHAVGNLTLTTPAAFLDTIRDSGRELMYTVNNLIKLSRWTEVGASQVPLARLSTFTEIESDIMHEVVQTVPARELSRISIIFINMLVNNDTMVVVDISLLKDCIQALLLNALLNTDSGAVAVVISAPEDYSRLTFDVYDSGCGIAPQDQQRIFDAYAKVDQHTRGVGLGLTLASKTASVLHGLVSLVSSSQRSQDSGSHFRAEFMSPSFACPPIRAPLLSDSLKDLPRSFHVMPASSERNTLVLHLANYLQHCGFTDSRTPDDSWIIVSYTPDTAEFRKLLESVNPRQVAICLIPANASSVNIHQSHHVRLFSGPFLTARLEEIIRELDMTYRTLKSEQMLSMKGGETTADSDHSQLGSGAANVVSPADVQPVALLVDDNVVNLRIMRMYCEKRSIKHITAMDGTEAVEQFRKAIQSDSQINLILMDLQMPQLDGVEATRIIREIERSRAFEPSCIFMITGQDSLLDKKESFEAGANEFYVKPLSLKTLDRGIAEYFPAFAQRISQPRKSESTNGDKQYSATSATIMLTRKTSRLGLRPA